MRNLKRAFVSCRCGRCGDGNCNRGKGKKGTVELAQEGANPVSG